MVYLHTRYTLCYRTVLVRVLRLFPFAKLVLPVGLFIKIGIGVGGALGSSILALVVCAALAYSANRKQHTGNLIEGSNFQSLGRWEQIG